MYFALPISAPDDPRCDALRQALSSEATRLQITITLLEASQLDTARQHSCVIVFLGSVVARANVDCCTILQRAIDLKFPIVPVVEHLPGRTREIPEQLNYLKTLDWPRDAAVPEEVITVILEVLGIREKERKLFVSYRQADAGNPATQLYHALTERRFDVFLDRFETSAPENIQERIDEALEEMAFVLLLWSPDMHNSRWVDWEITRALKSQLPLLIVKWTNAINIPKLSEANLPTVQLDPERDLEAQSVIRREKLAEILRAVELCHADGLFRRRRESLLAARLLAESKGWEAAEDAGWQLLIKRRGGGQPLLLKVTPRLARAEDLHDLDSAALPAIPVVGMTWRKVLLQNATELPERRRRFLEWTISTRELKIALGVGSLGYVL